MTAEAEFIADPVGFMSNNIVRPVIFSGPHANPHRVSRFTLSLDPASEVKKNSYHWYSRSSRFYKLTTDPNGNVRAYVLGYDDNNAVGTRLDPGPTTAANPALMITYRMDGCSLGYQQAAGGPAYVSHHNDKAGGNDPATIAGQGVNWDPAIAPAAAPAMNFMHKNTYMADSSGAQNVQYKATVIGVRDANDTWHFYYQARKRKGNGGDDMNKWTLKGMVAI